MDVQSPGRYRNVHDRSLGELFHGLLEDGGNLLGAEVRLAEMRLTQRLRLLAGAAIFFGAAAGLALIALMGVGFVIALLLAPVIGFLGGAVVVAILAGVGAWFLLRSGQAKLAQIGTGLKTDIATTKAEIASARDQIAGAVK